MKNRFYVSGVLILCATSLFASANDIVNFHSLPSKNGKVFRSAAPGDNLHQLKENDITHVLIFKNDTKGEVALEKKLLTDSGIKVKHIPFKWKEIESTKKACGQAIDALNYVIDTSASIENGVLFHCTVGEDRTGLLAGLYRLAVSAEDANPAKRWSVDKAFKNEMCKYGFANGNRNKPPNVVAPILKELYPVYRMAAAALDESLKKREKPNKKYCRDEAIVNITPVRCP